MSDNLQLLLQEALNNNSYDYTSMHLALKRSWENSFSYLYELQHSKIEYEELFYYSNDDISRNCKKLGDIHLDRLNRATFDVDYDVIRAYTREEYRTSEYYQKEIHIMKLIEHPHIFNKMPIVIIDGHAIWDFKIKVQKDATTFILPFKRNFVIESYRTAGYYKPSEENPDLQVWVPGSRKGNTFTIDSDLGLYVTDPSGDEVDIGYNFVPARVHQVKIMIEEAIREGKTILDIKDEIDQYLFDYYHIDECDEDHITLTELTDDIIYKDHKVQVLVVDNMFYHRYQIHRRIIQFNDEEHSIRINYSSLGDTLGHLVPPKHPGMFMLSFHLYKDSYIGYELGSALFPAEKRDDHLYAILSPEMYDQLVDRPLTFYLSIVFVHRLHEHKFWTGSSITEADLDLNTNLCVIEKSHLKPYSMPIPIENFIVMKNPVDYEKDYEIVQNVDSLKMYYPNIYELQDPDMVPGDQYRLFYFYYEGYDLKYTFMHHFYYEFLYDIFGEDGTISIEEVIDKIYHGKYNLDDYFADEIQVWDFKTIFTKIINYKHFKFQYGDVDFLHRYLADEANIEKVPTEYKDETLREWIRNEPFILREYVKEQKRRGVVFGLWTNTLNLSTRVRTDTSQELETSIHFDDPRYVFAISNKMVYPQALNVRVFVDGLFVTDMYQDRKLFMDYIYIPVSMVTEDSYIEVEVFKEISVEDEVTFTSLDEEKEIQVFESDKNITPTLCDITYIDEDDNHRYDRNFFDLTAIYEKATFPIQPVSKDCPIKFTRLTHFKIKPNHPYVLNKPFKIRLSKAAVGKIYQLEKDGSQLLMLETTNFGMYPDFIRVFVNGRILPKERYFINTLSQNPTLYLADTNYKKGDKVFVDITPYRYTQVYYQEKLMPDELVIDLKGYITKPFDIRYYDVYMNGRKLNQTNVWTVDPWSITLTNLHSIYNLVIFEKERDYEYFGLKYRTGLYYFSFEELLRQTFITEEEKNIILKRLIDAQKDPRTNIKPNVNDEERLDYHDISKWMKIYSFYHDELIPRTYYHPSEKQTSTDVLSEIYTPIYDTYLTTAYDETDDPVYKERRKNYPPVVTLNPDVDLAKREGNKDLQLVYIVGHPEEVEQELLDQEVTIENRWLIGGEW